MLRRLARSAVAHGLRRSGVGRAIGRISGVEKEPLVLGYHRVFAETEASVQLGVPSMGISVSTLKRHLEFVGRRFRFVSLDEMGRRIEEGTAKGFAAVTFDDGYVDFHDHAFPLLQRLGIPAAVFVVTDLVDKAASFLHDRVYESLHGAMNGRGPSRVEAFLAANDFMAMPLPGDAFKATRMLVRSLDHEGLSRLCSALDLEFGKTTEAARSLTWDELRRLSRAGITVGSHTRTHALLTRENAARVLEETSASRLEIEANIGARVSHFVYPDGAFDTRAVRAVARAGYRYAYTGCRHRDPRYPLLTLPRRVLWEGSTLGALGTFSADVLSGQINGVFDLMGRCSDDHGRGPATAKGGTRVAVVAPSLDVPGGQSIQAAAVADGLVEDGFRVRFLATDPRFPAGLRWMRRVPVARTLLNQALYAAQLPGLRHSDVVHVFSASFWSFLLAPAPAMLIARLFGKRVVLNYHSGEAAEHLARWGPLVHPWLRLAHEIVVPSPYLQGVFAAHGYGTRVVRNVVDTSRFRYRIRAPLEPRLLSTRTLEPNYRVDVILDAFALLKRECPNATLLVAGSGSEEGALRLMADSIGGVTFLGRVAPESMPELCASADLFLNASVVDNQPLSLLEAFASGLPVITTATGGIADMVRHGQSCMIVPPRDPAAMAAAALSLLRNQEAALRIAQGARPVAESHSWAAVREQWAQVYSGKSIDTGAEGANLRSHVFTSVGAGTLDGASLAKERRC